MTAYKRLTLALTSLAVMVLIGVAQAETELAPEGTVARSVFTTAVVDHEPVDDLEALDPQATNVTLFTELVGLAGTTVTHRWYLEDKLMAEVPIDVEGPRWRAYSTKTVLPQWSGTWKVEVVDATGRLLEQSTIEQTGIAEHASVPSDSRANIDQ